MRPAPACAVLIVVICLTWFVYKVRLVGPIRMDRQFRGPYRILYKEQKGVSRKVAFNNGFADVQKTVDGKYPFIFLTFGKPKKVRKADAVYWAGFAISTETREKNPELFEGYTEDNIFLDNYLGTTVNMSNRFVSLLFPLRLVPNVLHRAKHNLLEVYDNNNQLTKYIVDVNIASKYRQ